jgi:hypothetical protein
MKGNSTCRTEQVQRNKTQETRAGTLLNTTTAEGGEHQKPERKQESEQQKNKNKIQYIIRREGGS